MSSPLGIKMAEFKLPPGKLLNLNPSLTEMILDEVVTIDKKDGAMFEFTFPHGPGGINLFAIQTNNEEKAYVMMLLLYYIHLEYDFQKIEDIMQNVPNVAEHAQNILRLIQKFNVGESNSQHVYTPGKVRKLYNDKIFGIFS